MPSVGFKPTTSVIPLDHERSGKNVLEGACPSPVIWCRWNLAEQGLSRPPRTAMFTDYAYSLKNWLVMYTIPVYEGINHHIWQKTFSDKYLINSIYTLFIMVFHILYSRVFQTVGPGPKFGPLTDCFGPFRFKIYALNLGLWAFRP